jgi:hypothetical protein
MNFEKVERILNVDWICASITRGSELGVAAASIEYCRLRTNILALFLFGVAKDAKAQPSLNNSISVWMSGQPLPTHR